MEASATPGAITGLNATATGSDGQASITFDAPASHGASSTVTCTVGGSSCGTWTFPTGGRSGVTETINGLTNGNSTTISLVDCNGSKGLAGSGSACDGAATTTVTTFGPLKSASAAASASGTTVSFTVSVNPNGKAASVHVQTSKQDRTFTTGTGSWSWSSSDDMGYSATDTVRITVTSAGRATVTAQDSATTVAPPATLVVSKGRACGGGGGSPCVNGSCTASSCAYIHLHTTNYVGSYTCDFSTTYNDGGPGYAPGTYSSNMNADTTKWLGAAGYTLTVSCHNSSQSASQTITWY
jgi:hypothetical protein